MEISTEQQQDEDRARIFIQKHTWKFAKTMPWSPHFYVVKTYLNPADQLEFDWFVTASRKYGKLLAWGKKEPKPYWFIDNYKYWTMMFPVEETIIINRAEHHV